VSPAPADPAHTVESLYAGHAHWLRRWLHGKLGDRHCAEDLAHDTFMRLLDREEALVPREPRALLTTIASRVLVSHWRRRQVEAAWLDALAALPPAHHPDPEQQHILLETLVEIDRLLDGLPVLAKRAFLLSQLDGLTHAQVAAQLGISVTTVKRHLLRASQRCGCLDQRLPALRQPHAARLAHATLAAAGGRGRRGALKSLAAACALGGAAAWLVAGRQAAGRWPLLADYRTGHGRRMALRLDDGTRLTLNGDSAVDVHYGPAERRIALRAGEILVETARDALARPFLVETAQGLAQALGTRYLLRQEGDAVRVDVFEGAVRLVPRRPGSAPAVLQAGQRAALRAGGVGAVAAADPDAAAWRDGMLVASRMRLDAFVDELNRYSAHPVACAPEAAGLRLSGSYPLADIGHILHTLPQVLPVRVETRRSAWAGKRTLILPR